MTDAPVSEETQGRLAIIAGGGGLPARIAGIVAASGRPLTVIAVRGEADEAGLEAFAPHWLDWGQIGRLFTLLASEKCRDVVLIGSIRRRPSLRSLLGDWGTLRRLPRIIAAIVGGDDNVLKNVVKIFEDEGYRVVGAHDIAPQLLAPAGVLTRAAPDEAAERDVRTAATLLRAISPFDVGQAAVVARRRVIAVEAAEGTDQMLVRCATLRREGRIGRGPDGALVKCVKGGQELRADLPTIGPATVAAAAEARLSGIAVEAGRVLIADLDATIAAADAAGLFIVGIEMDGGTP